MRWLDEILSYLLPNALVEGTPWKQAWEEQQKDAFLRSCKIAFPIIAIGFGAHFPLFDVPMGLQPIEMWAAFRFSLVAICLLVFFYYRSELVAWRGYKIPAFIGAFCFCHAQAWVTVFYGKEAWFFFFAFIILTCLFLRLTSLGTLLWSILVVLISLPVLLVGDVGSQNILSGAIFATLSASIIRSAALTEVRLFLANRERDQAQQQLVEVTADYAARIKSFIPRVIADRLTYLMEEQRLNVVEASVRALKSRRRTVSCLFTDIRGFTQGSKDLDGFVSETVIPEVSSVSDAIEDHKGIPRKIGDLVFAYFDDEQPSLNVARAFLSAYEVARINESINAGRASTIKRYILLSHGDAMVGNFGGLDTSIEITALGTPVNYLSRVDELTKSPKLAEKLLNGDILYDESTNKELSHIGIDLEHEVIDLQSLGLTIRDFPEISKIYLHSPNDFGYERLSSLFESL